MLRAWSPQRAGALAELLAALQGAATLPLRVRSAAPRLRRS
jgi:hypothetical protein